MTILLRKRIRRSDLQFMARKTVGDADRRRSSTSLRVQSARPGFVVRWEECGKRRESPEFGTREMAELYKHCLLKGGVIGRGDDLLTIDEDDE